MNLVQLAAPREGVLRFTRPFGYGETVRSQAYILCDAVNGSRAATHGWRQRCRGGRVKSLIVWLSASKTEKFPLRERTISHGLAWVHSAMQLTARDVIVSNLGVHFTPASSPQVAQAIGEELSRYGRQAQWHARQWHARHDFGPGSHGYGGSPQAGPRRAGGRPPHMFVRQAGPFGFKGGVFPWRIFQKNMPFDCTRPPDYQAVQRHLSSEAAAAAGAAAGALAGTPLAGGGGRNESHF